MLKEEFKNLFIMLVRNGQICGENAIDVFHTEKGDALTEEDKESLEQTKRTIENYRAIEDKLLADEPLTILEYNYLYIAAKIAVLPLQKTVARWSAVLNEYENNLIPNLEKVLLLDDDQDKSDAIAKLFEETFEKEKLN